MDLPVLLLFYLDYNVETGEFKKLFYRTTEEAERIISSLFFMAQHNITCELERDILPYFSNRYIVGATAQIGDLTEPASYSESRTVDIMNKCLEYAIQALSDPSFIILHFFSYDILDSINPDLAPSIFRKLTKPRLKTKHDCDFPLFEFSDQKNLRKSKKQELCKYYIMPRYQYDIIKISSKHRLIPYDISNDTKDYTEEYLELQDLESNLLMQLNIAKESLNIINLKFIDYFPNSFNSSLESFPVL